VDVQTIHINSHANGDHIFIPDCPFQQFLSQREEHTTRAIARAPYTSEYPCFASSSFVALSTSIVILRLFSLSSTSRRRSDTIWRMDYRESRLNTCMSRRLRSSGGKYSEVRSRTRFFGSSVTTPLLSQDEGCARISLPRLLVRQMIVF